MEFNNDFRTSQSHKWDAIRNSAPYTRHTAASSPIEHSRAVGFSLDQVVPNILAQPWPAERRNADQGRQVELEHIAQDVVIERQEVLHLALADSVPGSGDVAEGVSSLEGGQHSGAGKGDLVIHSNSNTCIVKSKSQIICWSHKNYKKTREKIQSELSFLMHEIYKTMDDL